MSLKKRIIAAVVLIAAIHAAFYCFPRWWQTRARFYQAGYDRAVAVLRQEFGDAAVDRGIVSIPKAEVSVPLRGFATAKRDYEDDVFVVHLDGDAAAIVTKSAAGLQAAAIPPELAREVWTAFLYANKAQCKGDNPLAAGELIDTATMDTADRTWPRPQPAPAGDSQTERDSMSSDALRGVLGGCLGGEFLAANGIRLSSEKDVVLPIVRRMVGQSIPSLDGRDEDLLRRLGDMYVHLENADGLPILKRLEALSSEANSPDRLGRFYGTPLIGDLLAKLHDWRSESRRNVNISVTGDIWRIQKIDGKPDEEAFKIVCVAAFPPVTRIDASESEIVERAREILRERWPDRLKGFIAEHYDLVDSPASFLPSENPEWAGDERFVRKVLNGSPRGELRAKALASLYMLTKDRAPVSELESMARDKASSDPMVALVAARKLIAIYAKDKAACDAPAIVAYVFDAMTPRPNGANGGDKPQQAPVGFSEAITHSQEEFAQARRDLVSYLDEQGPEYAPIPTRLLVSPGSGPSAAGSDDSELLRYVVNALSLWPVEGADAFGRYLETPRAGSDSKTTYSVVDALCMMGVAEALPVLEKAGALTLPPPKDDGSAESPQEPLGDRFHRAQVYIKLRNAADPVAAFRALSPADRKVLLGWQLAMTFTKEDLQAFLCDDTCADMLEQVFAAFYWRDVRGHLAQRCLECTRKCEEVRRLFPPGSQPPAPQPALTSSR